MKKTVLCALSGLPAARPVPSTQGVPSSGLPSFVSYGLSQYGRPVMPVAAINIASSRRDNGCGASADWNESDPERNVDPAATLRDRRPKIASHNGYSRAALNPCAELITSLRLIACWETRMLTHGLDSSLSIFRTVEVVSMPVRSRTNICALTLMLIAVVGTVACGERKPKPGTVLDEAMQAKRTVDTFPAADEDYFHDMDGAAKLTKEQIQGRNMWLVWTGGNDRLWDVLSRESFGSLDFIKTLSSHPTLPYSRDTRWTYLGLVNEPCFTKATGPDPNRYGLWLDVRDPKCPPDPFENADKYKGVQVGARGKTVPVGSYYGEASGIVGLRLFPNPDFDEKARRAWDSERYYRAASYYEQRDLVKPYRVAMTCGFCHVGPNPVKPPKDPERPEWAELSSNVGAQFFWWDRVFDWKATTNEQSFLYQALHTSLPGTLDTSLVSTDNINNPRTMNAVYGLGPRMALAKRWGKETLSGGGLDNKHFNEFVQPSDPLAQFFTPPSTTWTPRVLKDGSDSVGALGALNRVYLNIGLFSEEWLLHFRPLIGGQEISPIKIADARKNSVFWQAIERQTPYMADFFLATTDPHYLRDAPNGPSYLTEDAASTRRGKTVFAERCARCHSSKIPPLPTGLDLESCNGKNYLGCWDK